MPNGLLDTDEACDDGNQVNTDVCKNDCTWAKCGDNVRCLGPTCGLAAGLSGPEACDDGNVVNGDGCSADCSSDESCGNGFTDTGEVCDDGGESATCNADCTTVACGDSKINSTAGEACDDGNVVNGDGCDSNCTTTACGNGILTGIEACDDGNVVNGDGCDSNCTTTACGNGIETGIEECDDDNEVEIDFCKNDCTKNFCGDGVVCSDADTCTSGPDGGVEECDPASTENPMSDTVPGACRTDCASAHCGDGVTDDQLPYSEACDESGQETESCDTDCTAPECGDELVNNAAGEECDQGSEDTTEETGNSNTRADACRATCMLPHCGDSVKDSAEQCDDSQPGGGCNSSCCYDGSDSLAHGFVGADCQFDVFLKECNFSLCKAGLPKAEKRLTRRVGKMQKRALKAKGRYEFGNAARAEKVIIRLRRGLGRLMQRSHRSCPEAQECIGQQGAAAAATLLNTQIKVLEAFVAAAP